MSKLIQLYLVCVWEFLVCMQFNAKIKQKNKTKKKTKKKKKKTDPDQTLYSVSSAEAQKVVKFKFGEFLQSLGYRFACSQIQKNKTNIYALYLDISCLILETICRKNQSFIYWKNMKNVSVCSPVLLCTRHRAKLQREVTPLKKII